MEKRPQPKSGEESRKAYVKYSGMGFSIAASIFMGVLIGQYLDEKFATAKPYWTAGMALLFLLIGMYAALRDILFPPEKKKK